MFPEIAGTQITNLGRMKGWVNPGTIETTKMAEECVLNKSTKQAHVKITA